MESKSFFKPFLRKSYRFAKRWRLRRQEPLTRDDLHSDLVQVGVAEGDCVIIHGSLSKIGYIEGGANTLVNAVLEIITDEGTLAVPSLSLEKGSMLDSLKDPRRVVDLRIVDTPYAISREIMERGDSHRSVHPTHSVSAIGKDAKWIVNGHENAGTNFGRGTPWHKLMELDGKLLGIGIPFGPVTFVHAIEDVEPNFPIQVYCSKEFKTEVIGPHGRKKIMTVRAHDPAKSKTRIDKRGAGWIREFFFEILQTHFGLKTGTIGQAQSWVVNLQDVYNAQKWLLSKDITIYTTKDEFDELGLPPIKSWHYNEENGVA